MSEYVTKTCACGKMQVQSPPWITFTSLRCWNCPDKPRPTLAVVKP